MTTHDTTLFTIIGWVCIFVCWIVMVLGGGCNVTESKAVRILEQEGCTDIEVGSYVFFSGCSEDDLFNSEFTCKRNGKPAKGVVCQSFWGGVHPRYY